MMVIIDKSSPTMADEIIKMLSDDNISQTSRVNVLFLTAHRLLDDVHKLSLLGALAANLVNKYPTPDLKLDNA